MSFLDKLKRMFGKAKDRSDAMVDENREKIPDNVEKAYDKVSDAAEKIAPGSDAPGDPPAGGTGSPT